MYVLIDPGHGGDDPGAIGINGDRECDVTLDMACRLATELGRFAVDVAFTHMGDGKSLQDRVLCCNGAQPLPSLFLSLHCNAHSNANANGFEAFTSRGDTGADRYATRIYKMVQAEFPTLRMRSDWDDGDPDKEAGFYVLRKTHCPAVLVEMGFITNGADHAMLMSTAHRDRLTTAITQAILV